MQNSLKTVFMPLALMLAFTFVTTSAMAFPGGGSQSAPAASTAPSRTAAQGTVVETMDSGGYTYLQIENNGQKTWAAIPNSDVKVGQEVQLAPGMTMNGFTSKTLGRTFDAIVFSQGLVSAK